MVYLFPKMALSDSFMKLAGEDEFQKIGETERQEDQEREHKVTLLFE